MGNRIKRVLLAGPHALMFCHHMHIRILLLIHPNLSDVDAVLRPDDGEVFLNLVAHERHVGQFSGSRDTIFRTPMFRCPSCLDITLADAWINCFAW